MNDSQGEYDQGTQRLCDPEDTLQRILPIMGECGISRVVDMTYLDRIGIPTYAAVRPEGLVLSISNGKGWTKAAAAVSAIMESIEVEHAEYPTQSDWHLATSAQALAEQGYCPISPEPLIKDCLWPEDKYGGFYYSHDLILDWVEGTDLISGDPVILPASAAYVTPPFTHYFTSNGLASGNSFEEATLHGISEIVERDAIAHLTGRHEQSPPSGLRAIALDGLPQHLADLAKRVISSGIDLFLISVPSSVDIYTFWALFWCPGEPAFILGTSGGYGSHPDPVIAASRALTEAAQARLAHIHGAREDLGIDHNNVQLTEAEMSERIELQASAFAKFRLLPTYSWGDFIEECPHRAKGLGIDASLELLLEMLQDADYQNVYVRDLTKPDLGIAVTRTFIPGMKVSVAML